MGPPTRIILPISFEVNLASDSANSTECLHFSIIGLTIASSFEREIFIVKCFGPFASAVIKGKFISVSNTFESSILAFSAASFNRCIAILSFLKSMPDSFLNSEAM